MTTVERVTGVARRAGLPVEGPLATEMASFIGLMAKWNATLNLTGLELDPASDEAIMRLIVEPVAAAALVPPGVKLALDVGSGGGSPAIPLKLARRDIPFVLVESKSRKCAFLREAVRHLELTGIDVVNSRLQEVASRVEMLSRVDLVTVRAVRMDAELWVAVRRILAPGARALLFGTTSSAPSLPAGAEILDALDISGTESRVTLAMLN